MINFEQRVYWVVQGSLNPIPDIRFNHYTHDIKETPATMFYPVFEQGEEPHFRVGGGLSFNSRVTRFVLCKKNMWWLKLLILTLLMRKPAKRVSYWAVSSGRFGDIKRDTSLDFESWRIEEEMKKMKSDSFLIFGEI